MTEEREERGRQLGVKKRKKETIKLRSDVVIVKLWNRARTCRVRDTQRQCPVPARGKIAGSFWCLFIPADLVIMTSVWNT